MKFLVAVFATIVMSACAAPSAFYHQAPLAYSAVIYQPVHPISQWSTHSGLGGLVYGYHGDPSAKSEIKTLDPSKLQTINYIADSLGFRVAVVNLPKPPDCDEKASESVEDTPEVKATKSEDLEIVTEVKKDETLEDVALEDPEQVKDTDEGTTDETEELESVTESKEDEAPEDVVLEDPEQVKDTDEATTTKIEDLESVTESKKEEGLEVALIKDVEQVKDTDEGTIAETEDLETITVKNDEVPVAISKVAQFRAPKQVEDNDDVKAARAEHLKAIEFAKAEHFKAVEAVKTRSLDPVHYSAPLSYSTHPVVTLKSDVTNQAFPLFQWWSTFFPPRHTY